MPRPPGWGPDEDGASPSLPTPTQSLEAPGPRLAVEAPVTFKGNRESALNHLGRLGDATLTKVSKAADSAEQSEHPQCPPFSLPLGGDE